MKFTKLTRRESERDALEGRAPISANKRMLDSNGVPMAQPTNGMMIPERKPESPPSITMQTPDNVIGETLVVQGRVEFKNLLRIDGHFEGELVGSGSLIIGPTAEVISNLKGLHEVYVEGILIGDVACEKMQIRFAGCVTGNIQCSSLGMDPSVVLKGSANVNPRDRNDNANRSKLGSRGNPPRPGYSHSRTRSQAPNGTEDAIGSSRTSHASTAALSPDSDDESISVLAEDPKQVVGFDDSASKGGSRSHRSRRSRTSGSGSTGSTSAVSEESSPPEPSYPSSSGGDGEKIIVPRMGDSVNMPVRNRPPAHQVK